MFDAIKNFFKKISKEEKKDSKDTAKERLHLVLMQDRANVSADFLEMMKQEIIEVIKKYIDVDENSIDVKLTNKVNSDGTTGAPALYANIPIVSLKDDVKKIENQLKDENEKNIEANEKSENEKENKQEEEHLQGENKEDKNNEENDETKENAETGKNDEIVYENKSENSKKVEAE